MPKVKDAKGSVDFNDKQLSNSIYIYVVKVRVQTLEHRRLLNISVLQITMTIVVQDYNICKGIFKQENHT